MSGNDTRLTRNNNARIDPVKFLLDILFRYVLARYKSERMNERNG